MITRATHAILDAQTSALNLCESVVASAPLLPAMVRSSLGWGLGLCRFWVGVERWMLHSLLQSRENPCDAGHRISRALEARRENEQPEEVPADVHVPGPTGFPDDDLTMIRGVGGVLAGKLRSRGIRRFQQIAAWTSADVEAMDEELLSPAFKARALREDWPGQARAAFIAKYGRSPDA